MVRLLSYMTLSALLIAPAFASSVWDLETRDVSETQLFEREAEMEGLFARQEGNAEFADLARRKFSFSFGKALKGMASLLFRRELDANRVHAPPVKHELSPDNIRRSFDDDLVERDFNDELLERSFDDDLVERDFSFNDELVERDFSDELNGRDLTEEDLFERYYDDLD